MLIKLRDEGGGRGIYIRQGLSEEAKKMLGLQIVESFPCHPKEVRE